MSNDSNEFQEFLESPRHKMGARSRVIKLGLEGVVRSFLQAVAEDKTEQTVAGLVDFLKTKRDCVISRSALVSYCKTYEPELWRAYQSKRGNPGRL